MAQGPPVLESLGCLLKCKFLDFPPDPLNQYLQKQLWTPDFPKAHQGVPVVTVGWKPLPKEKFLGFSHHLWPWMRAGFLGESTLPCDGWVVELKYPIQLPEPSWEIWAGGKPHLQPCFFGDSPQGSPPCYWQAWLKGTRKFLFHVFFCSRGWDETAVSLTSSL